MLMLAILRSMGIDCRVMAQMRSVLLLGLLVAHSSCSPTWSSSSTRACRRTLRVAALLTSRHSQIQRLIVEALKRTAPSLERMNLCVDVMEMSLDTKLLNAVPTAFETGNELCRRLEQDARQVHLVIGPFDGQLESHVSSICNALDVPHISLFPPSSIDVAAVHVHFGIEEWHRCLLSLLSSSNWTRVGLVYYVDWRVDVRPIASSRCRRALRLQTLLTDNDLEVIGLPLRSSQEMETLVQELKRQDAHWLLLDLPPTLLVAFLRLCRVEGVVHGDDWQVVVVDDTFDQHAFNLALRQQHVDNDNRQGETLTSFVYFRMADPEMPFLLHLASQVIGDDSNVDPDTQAIFRSQLPFIHDSLLLVLESASNLAMLESRGWELSSAILEERPSFLDMATNVSCRDERPWRLGASFINYLNAASVQGLTGQVVLQSGRRVGLSADLMLMSPQPLQVGSFVGNTLRMLANASMTPTQPNVTVRLRVVTRVERPYVMLRSDRSGNDAFEGFVIDLLKAIAQVLHFEFTLYTVPDNLYGVFDHDTNEWNGIVRQLKDRRADLAVAAMTINYAREQVIDFTKPFMNLGISILFKAPIDPSNELFSFMNPLAFEIWLSILLAYSLVSITMWIVARFSPYEWCRPQPSCVDTGTVVQNDFTLANSFWFAIGTLMQQGSELNPRAASTRIVGGIWWFFTLILISSYTANLAAFLTVERMVTPIKDAEDLAEQSSIKYGTLLGGSSFTFFRDSKTEMYQKMWRYMESNEQETFTSSYEEGVARVLAGNYAFLGESTMIDYLMERNCNLTQVGGLLDNKGYGIATPKGSKWRQRISQAILYLQEKGVIQMYYDKWWKRHHHMDDTEDDEMSPLCEKERGGSGRSMANALGMVHIGGVFVVLLAGLALAIVVAVLEFCWHARKRRRNNTT